MNATFLKRQALLIYFVIAFGLFWLATHPAAISFVLVGLVASFAPSVTATVTLAIAEGSQSVRALFHGMLNIAAHLFFGGIASSLLSWLMPVGFMIVALLVLLLSGPQLTWRQEIIHQSHEV